VQGRYHQLELVFDDLFDVIYPILPGQVRGVKPLFSNILGSLVPDPNIRRLPTARSYFRLDFLDFMDYATSSLPSPAKLIGFPEDNVLFYQNIDLQTLEPICTFAPFENGIGIVDAALIRNKVFVTAFMRFRPVQEGMNNHFITSMNFAASPDISIPDSDIEIAPLEEWDRNLILPPTDGDTEWRFIMSGTYTNHLLDEMEKHPHRPGAIPIDQINHVRDSVIDNHTTYEGFFELTRLALYLPQYFAFMYDLVLNEPIEKLGNKAETAKIPKPVISSKPVHNPTYEIVKSIRIIRPKNEAGNRVRSWSPPKFAFAVTGHWRSYADKSTKGHDPIRNPVFGKTWVHEYTKGQGTPPQPGDTQTFSAEPKVVIKIKETLAYARDVIAIESERRQNPKKNSDYNKFASQKHDQNGFPTKEWIYYERAKLTAGLRFLIMKRDNFRCRLCGRSASDDPDVRLEVDHIHPVAAWGQTIESNLWTICTRCNRGKGTNRITNIKTESDRSAENGP
jgi:hypothetical protein